MKPKTSLLKKVLLCMAGFLCLLSLATYYCWTRLSAKMTLRWFVKEANLPISIQDASWEVRLSELRAGKIRDLDVRMKFKSSDLELRIKTPVSFLREGKRWKINLSPRVWPIIAGEEYPEVHGTVNIDTHGKVTFHLKQDATASFTKKGIRYQADRIAVDGFATRESADVDFSFEKVDVKKGSAWHAKLNHLKIASKNLFSKEHPPFPAQMDAWITGRTMNLVYEDIVVDEPRLRAHLTAVTEGTVFDPLQVKIFDPVPAVVNGSVTPRGAQGELHVDWKLKDVLQDRAAKWLEPRFSFLRRLKSKGMLRVKVKAKKKDPKSDDAPDIDAEIELNADSLDIPKLDLLFTGLKIQIPITLSGIPLWGKVSFDEFETSGMKFKDLALRARASQQGIEFTSVQADGTDRPFSHNIFGGRAVLSRINGKISKEGKKEFTATLAAGPFEISRVQQDLCIADKRLVAGTVDFQYPDVHFDDHGIMFKGSTDAQLFGGTARVRSIAVLFEKTAPKLFFDASCSDFDLAELGKWSKLGDMRGSLDCFLVDSEFSLTEIGPVPMQYHLLIKGKERSGQQIRFYGRAIYNIMELMGSSEKDFPWYAVGILRASTMWRNLLPAVAQYMGFEAVSKDGWTQLRTFDPPEAESKTKKHYFLYGSAFKIPLNTQGVYPVKMQSDAFQGWLYGMLEYFKKRFAEESKEDLNERKCKPIF